MNFPWTIIVCLLIHQLGHQQINIIKFQQIFSNQTLKNDLFGSQTSAAQANTHIFRHPFDLSRSLPPSQNCFGPWTGAFALHIVALLSRNKLFSRCDMNCYWFYCWKMENYDSKNKKLKSNSCRKLFGSAKWSFKIWKLFIVFPATPWAIPRKLFFP